MRILKRSAAILGAGIVALTVPVPSPEVTGPAVATPFRWDRDEVFSQLESRFRSDRMLPDEVLAANVAGFVEHGRTLLAAVAASDTLPTATLATLERYQFHVAAWGAVRAELLEQAEAFITETRVTVMRAAARWPADRASHEALYRVVFGGRIAMEEALVQTGPVLPALVEIEAIPSATPSIEVEGVRVHSGDILLSRGGAPTSALIARGSDFANTFSHAALAHVDPETGVGTVVESLIETGTVLTTVEEYLARKSHRILVLRLRPDLPELVADPMLPHRAATAMIERLSADPAPYDFAMAWEDPTRLFCSEVIYHAYAGEGIDLWSHRSAMSAPGLVRWLGAMGVRQFETLVPSDLEYDARLRAVIEWRDLDALTGYRLDNAITDVLLGEADGGAELSYPWYARPPARMLKAVSVVSGGLGASPMVPAGMSPDAALRVRALVSEVNPALRIALTRRAEAFERENGYPPPYWALVDLARAALEELRSELRPALR